MRIDFYQLGASPIERVLPQICERLLGQGERLLVVAAGETLAALDDALWSHKSDGFLPHGRADAPRAQAQPVLLSETADPINGATNIALADGRWREEALSFARTFYFFDAARIDEARASWRSLGAVNGAERHFWKQDGQGRWVEGP